MQSDSTTTYALALLFQLGVLLTGFGSVLFSVQSFSDAIHETCLTGLIFAAWSVLCAVNYYPNEQEESRKSAPHEPMSLMANGIVLSVFLLGGGRWARMEFALLTLNMALYAVAWHRAARADTFRWASEIPYKPDAIARRYREIRIYRNDALSVIAAVTVAGLLLVKPHHGGG